MRVPLAALSLWLVVACTEDGSALVVAPPSIAPLDPDARPPPTIRGPRVIGELIAAARLLALVHAMALEARAGRLAWFRDRHSFEREADPTLAHWLSGGRIDCVGLVGVEPMRSGTHTGVGTDTIVLDASGCGPTRSYTFEVTHGEPMTIGPVSPRARADGVTRQTPSGL